MMSLLTVLLLWTYCYQMIIGHSPASLKALATIHSHGARALANAVNLQARAHYNAALAKSRASKGRYDHRFIRDSSNNFSGEEQDPEFDETVSFQNGDGPEHDLEDHLIRETIFGHNLGQVADDVLLGQRGPHQFTNENFIGRHPNGVNLNERDSWLPQQLRENANQGDLLQIPLRFADLDGSAKLFMDPNHEDGMIKGAPNELEMLENSFEGSSEEHAGGCSTCEAMLRSQLDDYMADNKLIYPDSIAGSQLVFDQEFRCPLARFSTNQQEVVSGTPPTTFTQQEYSEGSNKRGAVDASPDESLFEPQMRQENEAAPTTDENETGKSAGLTITHQLRPHGHLHTHSYSHHHGISPLQHGIYIPTQVVVPGVNLHVIQNQNAAFVPQYATPAVHPGLHNAVANINPMAHVNTGYGTRYIQPSSGGQISHITGVSQAQSIMPHIQKFEHNLGGGVGYASGVSQSQGTHVHSASSLPSNQDLFVRPNNVHNGVTQTQTIHQEVREQPIDGRVVTETARVPGPLMQKANMRGRLVDFSGLPQKNFDRAIVGQSNIDGEKVGSFLHTNPIPYPEFHYDHNKPENRQNIVKYIENEQADIKRYLHLIENHDKFNYDPADHQYNNDEEYGQQYDNVEHHKQKLNQGNNVLGKLDQGRIPNFEKEKEVGTINRDQIPEKFEEYEADIQQLLGAEGKYVQRVLDQIDENYRRNMNDLSSLIDRDHRHSQNPEYFQNPPDSNEHIHNEDADNPDGNNGHKPANSDELDEEVETSNEEQIPESFEEFEDDLRQHLETEERYVQRVVDEFNENYRRRMDSLSNLIDSGNRDLHNLEHFQNSADVHSKKDIQVADVDIPDGDNGQKPANRRDEEVGTINMAQIPENFEELEAELRHHLEIENNYVHHVLDKMNEDYRHRMNSLPNLIDNDQRHSYNPEHFRNSIGADSTDHIQVAGIDVPHGNNVQKPANHRQLDEEIREAEESINKLAAQQTLLDKNVQDEKLGYIIQVPDRRYSEDYQRQARSFNRTTMAELDKLLRAEKNLINELKKDAKHDEDMMMIGYIGDSLIDDLENRLNKSRRGKREIGKNLPLKRLVSDPRAKLDMSKTLENIGTATRNVFEHDKAPLYHVRNLVGAAQDVAMAAMKIPTKNFLIPSAYEIVNTQGENNIVGAINPSLFSRIGGEDQRNERSGDEIMNTFQRVGSAIRGSVLSGQEALNHVGDVANHAKNAIHSTKYTTPRLILKSIPAISREPRKKTMLITPRIFDISAEDNTVGSRLGKQEPDFVKVGHIMDAVGVSNPNNNLEFEKIVIEPRSSFSDIDLPEKPKIKPPMSLKDFLESIKIEKIKNTDDDGILGNSLNNHNNRRSTVGATNLQDFIVKMNQKFKRMLNATSEKNINTKAMYKKLHDKNIKKIGQSRMSPDNSMKRHIDITQRMNTQAQTNQNINQKSESQLNHNEPQNPIELNKEVVGISVLPEEIQQSHLGQATVAQRQQFMQESREAERVGKDSPTHRHFVKEHSYEAEDNRDEDQKQRDRHLGQILGAINPMMLERIFNETVKINNTNATPHSAFHHRTRNSYDYEAQSPAELNKEVVGIGLLPEEIQHPFLGQATLAQRQEFMQENRGAERLGMASPTHEHFVREHNYEVKDNRDEDQKQRDRHLGQVLGAINPMMLERIFNETVKINNTNATPHSAFHHHNRHTHGYHHTEDTRSEETVSTMKLQGQLLKPFRGQASSTNKQEFFEHYMPEEDTQDEVYSSDDIEFENLPGLADWTDIFRPFQENSVEYD